MKPFVVTVMREIDVVVIAESEMDAQVHAEENSDAILEDATSDVLARAFNERIHKSFMSTCPYTKDGEADVTLKEMIDAGSVTL